MGSSPVLGAAVSRWIYGKKREIVNGQAKVGVDAGAN
jgi:hypothetical protein